MKKIKLILPALFCIVILSGCSTTFGGSVIVFKFTDFIYYVLIALIAGCACAAVSKKGTGLRQFWTWFILSLVLTPLSGLICFIILITRKKKPQEK